MKRLVQFVIACCVFVAAACPDARATCAPSPTNVPAELAVPSDHCVKDTVFASGVQIYVCDGAWVLKAPEASLYKGNVFVGVHFLGPTWQWIDSSKLKASRIAAMVPGKQLSDIPWLLWVDTSHENGGELQEVTYVQRINTIGGAPPHVACLQGAEIRVPFRADFVFWRPRH